MTLDPRYMKNKKDSRISLISGAIQGTVHETEKESVGEMKRIKITRVVTKMMKLVRRKKRLSKRDIWVL
jgi:hypothetical protein